MSTPTIADYMTRQVWTIPHNASVGRAHALMREHQIRHLPVLDNVKLVGVITERDLYLIERVGGTRPGMKVEEAMHEDVYTACTDDPVDTVAQQMARNKYGSVVVVDPQGAVAGIFTMVDGMRVLSEVLSRPVAT